MASSSVTTHLGNVLHDDSASTVPPEVYNIAVMGLTGAGKSTIISKLTKEKVAVGHRLESHTSTVDRYRYQHISGNKTYEVCVIDTPGFDDGKLSDTEVLKRIVDFLAQTYGKKVLLSGILQLHRITDNRFSGSANRNIRIFKELCGEEAYKHVVLATSMWGKVAPGADYKKALENENSLIENDGYWGLMHKRGSALMRFDGTPESASNIISHLVDQRLLNGPMKLKIQQELVDEGKVLEETAAEKEVHAEWKRKLEKLEAEKKEAKEAHDEALHDKDQELAALLQAHVKEMEKLEQKHKEDLEKLKVDQEKLAEEQNAQRGKQQEERKSGICWEKVVGGAAYGVVSFAAEDWKGIPQSILIMIEGFQGKG